MTTPVTYPFPPRAPNDLAELLPELADCGDILASGAYLVTRAEAPGTVSHGVVTPSAVGYFWAVGSLTPASGRDVMRLPEGLRDRDAKSFITQVKLRALDGGTPPDLMTIDGVQYEVSRLSDWQQLAGFSQATLTKVPT